MIDLSKKSLPESVNIGGRDFPIQTDYRFYLSMQKMLREKSPAETYSMFFPEEKPSDMEAGFIALLDFYAPKNILPRGGSDGVKVVDYLIDGDLIYSAFMKCYNIDLVDTDLHWWKFLALFSGLRDTQLNDVIKFRSFDANDRTPYEKTMQKLKESWALPPETNEDNDEALKMFNSLFS